MEDDLGALADAFPRRLGEPEPLEADDDADPDPKRSNVWKPWPGE
jgi:hypothetical protein